MKKGVVTVGSFVKEQTPQNSDTPGPLASTIEPSESGESTVKGHIETPNSTFTNEQFDELLKQKYEEGYQAGKEVAEDESFQEISRLKKELDKPKINLNGLFQVQYEGETYELVSRGKFTFGDKVLTAKELIDDVDFCEELIEEGSVLFQKVKE